MLIALGQKRQRPLGLLPLLRPLERLETVSGIFSHSTTGPVDPMASRPAAVGHREESHSHRKQGPQLDLKKSPKTAQANPPEAELVTRAALGGAGR